MTYVLQASPKCVHLCAEISRLVGRYEGLMLPKPQPMLRRGNRIRSIQGSLAIEGNRLTLDQVTAIFNGKRVIGPKREILEVQNAIQAYEDLKLYKPYSAASLREAHRIMMSGLVADAGQWRKSGVGVVKGRKVVHVAPPFKRVPILIEELFEFLRKEEGIHALMKAAFFHYELEFIHPFLDGNGRIGRLWQTVLLAQHSPLFEYLPTESIVRDRQALYYKALGASDRSGNALPFIEFSLDTILDALKGFHADLKPERQTAQDRLDIAREHFQKNVFRRKDYLQLFKRLSTATASRDLYDGIVKKWLIKKGTKALARYYFR